MHLPRVEIDHLPLDEWIRLACRITVLGKFPYYIKLAKNLKEEGINVDYFYAQEWKSLTAKEQWKLNKKFLDAKIISGKKNTIIILSNYINNLNKTTGALREELDYLESFGYRVEEGFKVVK